ncbi:hypothetical protein BB558_007573 [Smittium angustum]|uniref:Uncharacterized protein n=1 Tax=Smittium angustum TaxID=133377 RepID=A0A2U1IUN9_SMIAN|nr:hypothetical protein BB558_007573 [Smittium angustum]
MTDSQPEIPSVGSTSNNKTKIYYDKDFNDIESSSKNASVSLPKIEDFPEFSIASRVRLDDDFNHKEIKNEFFNIDNQTSGIPNQDLSNYNNDVIDKNHNNLMLRNDLSLNIGLIRNADSFLNKAMEHSDFSQPNTARSTISIGSRATWGFITDDESNYYSEAESNSSYFSDYSSNILRGAQASYDRNTNKYDYGKDDKSQTDMFDIEYTNSKGNEIEKNDVGYIKNSNNHAEIPENANAIPYMMYQNDSTNNARIDKNIFSPSKTISEHTTSQFFGYKDTNHSSFSNTHSYTAPNYNEPGNYDFDLNPLSESLVIPNNFGKLPYQDPYYTQNTLDQEYPLNQTQSDSTSQWSYVYDNKYFDNLQKDIPGINDNAQLSAVISDFKDVQRKRLSNNTTSTKIAENDHNYNQGNTRSWIYNPDQYQSANTRIEINKMDQISNVLGSLKNQVDSHNFILDEKNITRKLSDNLASIKPIILDKSNVVDSSSLRGLKTSNIGNQHFQGNSNFSYEKRTIVDATNKSESTIKLPTKGVLYYSLLAASTSVSAIYPILTSKAIDQLM